MFLHRENPYSGHDRRGAILLRNTTIFLWMPLIGCLGGPPPLADGGPPPPIDPPIVADCRRTEDNALRVRCTASLDAPGAVRVSLSGDGVPTRTFVSSDPEQVHDVLAWGLRPETDYAWTVTDPTRGEVVSGRVSTASLPGTFAPLGLDVTHAGPSPVDGVLISPDCPSSTAVIVDGDGYVIWYQSMADLGFQGTIGAMTFSAPDTVVVVVGRSTLASFDLGGTVHMQADRGVDFAPWLHHDLFAKDGAVWAIGSTVERIDGVDWVVDGVSVFDGTGTEIDALSLSGLYPLVREPWMVSGYWASEFPDAVDFTHTNAVYVDDAGDVWLSFRHLHAFARLRGGPGTPGFGALVWTIAGSPDSPVAEQSDFALAGGSVGFEGQHDVRFAADGTILMFDNGLDPERSSRGVRYALDPDARTLTELDAWDTGVHCATRGSVRELPGREVLVACPTHGLLRAYPPASEAWSWQLEATCGGVVPVQFGRGIPIDL